jgi:ribonuclease D
MTCTTRGTELQRFYGSLGFKKFVFEVLLEDISKKESTSDFVKL